ncbi:hypothetical protein [Umezawaea sp. NPDC059074]|uniref:hypothetical protein n=1 Tax=Umezawaea sp. NPDC059074 TaxID=3346716 RepID=UPI003695FA59
MTTDDDLPGVVNRVSGGATGPVVQTGVHVGDVNLFTGVPVQTRYHKQVERVAPADLEGRDAELAELAAFCTSPAGGYAWWRAAAWSGKTALLSWFVLHPPEGVRLVSFFITARYAGQNTRDAFIRNVMEQLLDLTGQQPPVFLDDTNRETHLLGLLDDAAAACAKRGEHFVLLVDGLDEDRGVDTHSIAALLPADLHVVVAGRPDPVLPADVPEHHPLRNPAIVRHLAPSPKAQVIRVEAERELRGLLHGGPAGLDVLGLVTAAVGGLTPADLAALTDLSEWEVADLLTTAAGRSFTRRRTSSGGADVYLLGHEELQATAVTVLGPTRLERYRQRLHTWADGYRDRGWPVTTPDYLLRGYFAVLTETGDVARMVSCATDIARQDRILAQSGGDGSSLDEIAAAQAVTTDVVASLRLAVHHDYLGHRNATIPPDLPAAWMAAGRPDRATATARSIVDAARRAEAFVAMAKASSGSDSLTDLLTEAQKAIASIPDTWERSALLASLAEAAADHGDPDRAETLIGLASDPKDQVSALAHVALCAHDGRRQRLLSWAATLLPLMPDSQTRHRRLKSLLTTAATHGDLDQVTLLAHDLPREEGLPFLTVAAVRRGDAGHAEELVRGVTDPAERVDLLLGMATTGGPRAARWIAEARSAASTVDNQGGQAKALLLVAEAAATRGVGGLASEALAAGAEIARDLGDQWLCRLTIQAAAAMGDFTRAAELTRLIRPAGSAVRLLIEVATRAAETGHADRAAELFTKAERAASSAAGIPFTADGLLEEVARAVVESGDTGNAARIAQSTRYPIDVARLLVIGARTAIRAGNPARATLILEDAEARVRGNTGQAWLALTLDRLVAALARALDLPRATALVSSVGRDLGNATRDGLVRTAGVLFAAAGTIDLVGRVQGWHLSPFDEARVLSHVARVIARNGDHDLAHRTLTTAMYRARSVWGYREIHALMQVADGMIDIGDRAGAKDAVRRGEFVLPSLTGDPVGRMVALSAMAPVVEKVGLFDRAAALNAEAEQLWKSLGAGQRRAVEIQQPRRRNTRVDPIGGSLLDVLRSGQWHRAVPPMTAETPEVFDVLTAELSAVVRVPPTG